MYNVSNFIVLKIDHQCDDDDKEWVKNEYQYLNAHMTLSFNNI
jgi:hypothetical protein